MNTSKEAIEAVIKLYFMGTHLADAKQLRKAFHPDAHITGFIQDKFFDWSVEEFISRICNACKTKYDKKIIFIDQTDDAAVVKARVMVGDYIFTDYITLLKIADQWLIRNKSFSAQEIKRGE